MKTTFLVAMLLVTSSVAQTTSSTNNSAGAKKVLALYLVYGNVPTESLMNGTASPDGLKLAPQPILSDPDFVGWDVTNHTFVVTPTAGIRVGLECHHRTQPFVLMAEGVPIYLGAFWTYVSSTSCQVPVIIADLAVMDCFMGMDNVPDDVWRMIGRGDPGTLDRLLALAKTKPTTNVTFRIDLGYVSLSADAVKEAEKRCSDPRIAAAVQKLLGGRKP